MVSSSILSAAGALAAVLGAIWLLREVARRGGLPERLGVGRGRAGATRMLAVEESIALDSRRRLLLVRCGERRAVLLAGGGEAVLAWLP